jgi:hypothetical protein
MEKPNYYAILTAKVRYDKNLSDKAKLLYAEITALSNKTGECWAGDSYFSKLYACSKSCVNKNIALLKDLKYIEIVNDTNRRKIRLLSELMAKTPQGYGENAIATYGENATHNNTSTNTILNKPLAPTGAVHKFNTLKYFIDEYLINLKTQYANADPKKDGNLLKQIIIDNGVEKYKRALAEFWKSNDNFVKRRKYDVTAFKSQITILLTAQPEKECTSGLPSASELGARK